MLLVVLGSWLRFHHLAKKSLWSDELFTMAVALYHPLVPDHGQQWYRPINVRQIADGDTFLTVKAGEQSPPLQDLLVKASVHAFGASEWSARLPGAVAACMLLLWCAWLAWRERDPWLRTVLCWTLLLLVFHPVLVNYAKEGRAYSVGAAMVGIAALQWLRRWRNGARHWVPPGWLEIVAFALACYSHYTALVLVAMLLSADLFVACRVRSSLGLKRLLMLAVAVLAWLAINARTIVFTAEGGVAWGPRTAWQHAFYTLKGSLTVLHPPWLALCAVLLCVLLARARMLHTSRAPAVPPAQATIPVGAWGVLVAIIVLHTSLAGVVAAKVGMAHPRYYIFVVPLAAVAMAVVLAELRGTALKAAAAVAIVALAVPWLQKPSWMEQEDYRAMARYAAQDVTAETPFIFPWAPNRDMYRFYLDKMLGRDTRAVLVATSGADDVPRVCARLAQSGHVVAMGHASGHEFIDGVYAACGARWPHRLRQEYHTTFAEHWYAQPPATAPVR